MQLKLIETAMQEVVLLHGIFLEKICYLRFNVPKIPRINSRPTLLLDLVFWDS
jgi:hypothetical protein